MPRRHHLDGQLDALGLKLTIDEEPEKAPKPRRRTRAEALAARKAAKAPKPRRTRSEAVRARKLARKPAAERTWPERLGRPLSGAEAQAVLSGKKPHETEMKVIGFRFADGTILCRDCEDDLDKLHDEGHGYHMHLYSGDHHKNSAKCVSCKEKI